MTVPKGSKFTKRFGSSYKPKFIQTYGQRPTGTGTTKMSGLAPLRKLGEDETPSKAEKELEYKTLIEMVAEAYKVDLSSPEGLDCLPAIMREADRIFDKHQQLESCEAEMAGSIGEPMKVAEWITLCYKEI